MIGSIHGRVLKSLRWRMHSARQRLKSDRRVILEQYQRTFGGPPRLDDPQTFNEKLQWLKLHYHEPLLSKVVDKYAVREYVASRVGAGYLTKLYGVWSSPREICPDELPGSFVLKSTAGSGTNICVSDKSLLDWKKLKRDMGKWMKCSHYRHFREWAYKRVKPRIICEELLVDPVHGCPPDYKLFCFGGVPEFIQVDLARFTNHRRDCFDTCWRPLDFALEYPRSGRQTPPPVYLSEMLSVASRLAAGLPFCRVDLYCLPDRVVFGEMTFYPGAGLEHFEPEEWDGHWGQKLILPRTALQPAQSDV